MIIIIRYQQPKLIIFINRVQRAKDPRYLNKLPDPLGRLRGMAHGAVYTQNFATIVEKMTF